MTIVEMRVHMDCAGCESKIRKALQKLDGIHEIDIDVRMQKVTVMGWTDRKKVLKTVRKTGRRAEFWPFPHNAFIQPALLTYSSYNQYNPSLYDIHHFYPPPYNSNPIEHHQATTIFSDDNPHACSIM
ncbi:heavy metal-associated isoprenylated plant protein 28 isoform X2 [Carica papaya]|uniref:heavy metal-associated isoprenylated plant protein 28 isoform X2 n=1 Tax=Carica papaya TaxID=3649 RepID=UPI000B8CC01E|nr:heavy metal-associated isoprenylated plant protein 28 isoform X2 [Carica papaya]